MTETIDSTTLPEPPADPAAILALARRHGLDLVEVLDVDELGLDFRVATARDRTGTRWMLRMPRRRDVLRKIVREAQTLRYLAPRLPVAVPDWRIATPDLVAYPRLEDRTAMSVDAATLTPTWHIDPASPRFATSLAPVLAALHALPADEAASAGLPRSTPAQARQAFADDVDRVARELGMTEPLERRWRAWLDDDTSWPDFSVVVHGDLYVGHILVDERDHVTGIIDWTEAEISDPAIDFAGHLMAFGQDGVAHLLAEYERAGGRTWPAMARHVAERTAAAPIKYALFALESGDPKHLDAAKAQLSG